ncbi:MAG: response regulator transcription factor [Chloroflexi bacterium]|nr:response regulator transcription factor [Chloroflexota bacterium]
MTNILQNAKVLIVDDDPMLREAVELVFLQEGAKVYLASSGEEGLQKFSEHDPDLTILDILMPGLDGWGTLQQIRLLSNRPVILLTTLKATESIVRGLDHGADDFLSKPFDNRALLARARAVLRRTQLSRDDKPLAFSDDYLMIDLESRRVFVAGELVRLTETEFRLLAYLLQNPGQARTYRQILEHVWGQAYLDSIDYVHVYLSHLRRKIEKDPRKPRYLLNERGIGYRFERRRHPR